MDRSNFRVGCIGAARLQRHLWDSFVNCCGRKLGVAKFCIDCFPKRPAHRLSGDLPLYSAKVDISNLSIAKLGR